MVKVTAKPLGEKIDVLVDRVSSGTTSKAELETLAVEEPLEIRLGFYEKGKFSHKAISITMRTPGSDFALASGFLFTEGIIKSSNEISDIKHCGKLGQLTNTVRIDLTPETKVEIGKLERHFYTTSSCGVCGKSSIKALSTGAQVVQNKQFLPVGQKVFHPIPEKLREAQEVFDKTGGLHAAGLFNRGGDLLALQEDVGRHNAVDKLIGKEFMEGKIPLDDKILFLSGRASFELIQKAVMARIPIVAAVSAPSSLAVKAAKEFNITLLGFVRDDKYNIYTGSERISFTD